MHYICVVSWLSLLTESTNAMNLKCVLAHKCYVTCNGTNSNNIIVLGIFFNKSHVEVFIGAMRS